MNCLRFTTRTGLLALVAVLIVGGLMPVMARAAEKEVELFDPFALDAMMAATVGSGPAAAAVLAPMERTATTLRTPNLVIPRRPKLRSPFRPGSGGHFDL